MLLFGRLRLIVGKEVQDIAIFGLVEDFGDAADYF